MKAPVEEVIETVEETDVAVADSAPVEEEIETVEETGVAVVEDVDVEENGDDVIEVNVKEESASAGNAENSKFCANCGKEVELETVFCPQCGYRFDGNNAESRTKFCANCGEKININAEICPHCGVRVANIRITQEKSVLLSAILSFLFPGLGHLYLGLSRKGVSFIIAYIVSAILIFLLIGFVLIFIIWIWALVDSIRSTEAINRGEFVEDKLF